MSNFTDLTFEQILQQIEQLRDPNVVIFSGIPKCNMMTEKALHILADFPIHFSSNLLLLAATHQETTVDMRTDNPRLSLRAFDTKLRNIKRRLYQVCIDGVPVLEFVKYYKLT